jgi:hypothetical protein
MLHPSANAFSDWVLEEGLGNQFELSTPISVAR